MTKKLASTIHECTKQNPTLITDSISGEVFCSKCGVVLREKVEERTEIRSFSNGGLESKSRHGSPSKLSIYDMGNSSIISKKGTDASGRSISRKNRMHFSRLRLWDSRSKSARTKRGLVEAFIILDSIIHKLGLPENVKEHAAYIYRKAHERKIIRGKSIRAMVSASTYASCKQLGIPRSLDEIIQVADINRKTLSRTYRGLITNLDLDMTGVDVDYVSKIGNTIKASEKVKRISNCILEDIKKDYLHVGKNPIGLAAGAIYLSSIGLGENIVMTQISTKVNISTVTIRKTVHLLRPYAAKYIESIHITN